MDDPALPIRTGRQRVVLQLAEATGEAGVLRVGQRLIAGEQHLVPEQQLFDLAEQVVIRDRLGDLHIFQFRAQGAGQRFDLHGSPSLLSASLGAGSTAR